MRALLLSAYDAQSHRYWREQLVEHFNTDQWTILSLPGRYFSWRIRGNSMSWAFGEQREILTRDYDLIIATSMTDLSALRGFLPHLASIPTLVYFHENQFVYPLEANARQGVEPQILNIYTALSADYIAFNSNYNRTSFLEGAAKLLKKLPDQVPKHCIEQLEQKSTVLAVPLVKRPIANTDNSVSWQVLQEQPIEQRPLLIAWAARWEYDKGPERLLAIIEALEAREADFRLCILGQQFRHSPKQFEQIKVRFAHFIDHFGYADSNDEYLQWLDNADCFLSTAIHEFQGLSVLEAVQHGCMPCLPERLVYPELFDHQYLYLSCDDIEREAQAAVSLLLQQRLQLIEGACAPEIALDWHHLSDAYHAAFAQTLERFEGKPQA